MTLRSITPAGTAGTPVTVDNSAAYGDPFDGVFGAWTYSDEGVEKQVTSTGASEYLRVSDTSGGTRGGFKITKRYEAASTASQTYLGAIHDPNNDARMCSLYRRDTGAMRLTFGSINAVDANSTSPAMELGKVYTHEVIVDTVARTGTYNMYNSAGTRIFTYTGTADADDNTGIPEGACPGRARLGTVNNSGGLTHFELIGEIAWGTIAAGTYMEPASAPPTLTVSPGQSVPAGAQVSVTATASDDGAIDSYAWTVVSDESSTTPVLTDADKATATFAAPPQGHVVVLQCVVTDDAGLTATARTEVVVPSSSTELVPLAVKASEGTYVRVGTAATDGSALADASDGTYMETADPLSATVQWTRHRLQPAMADADLQTVAVRLGTAPGAGPGAATVQLVEGASTVLQAWTQAVAESPARYTLTLDEATVAAITDREHLSIRIGFSK